IGEPLLRLRAPAAHQAVGEERRIDRACRGAGNAFDAEPLVAQEMVKHAPGEGAMRAAALQAEIDALGLLHASGIRRGAGQQRAEKLLHPLPVTLRCSAPCEAQPAYAWR